MSGRGLVVWLVLLVVYSISDIRGFIFNIILVGGEEVYLMELLLGGCLVGGFYCVGGVDCEKN